MGSSWSTLSILPSDATPRPTGYVALCTSTGSSAASPTPARSLAVLGRATPTPRPLGAPGGPGGSGRTLLVSAGSAKKLAGAGNGSLCCVYTTFLFLFLATLHLQLEIK